jgi:hypothetical protein
MSIDVGCTETNWQKEFGRFLPSRGKFDPPLCHLRLHDTLDLNKTYHSIMRSTFA